MDNVFQEFGLLLILAAVAGLVALRLRQPLIGAYIVVGIAVGPSGFGWATAHSQIDLLSQIGITVLLFVVGLKLDLHLVKRLGRVALATGLGQLTFTIVGGFLLCLALGLDRVSALYVAVALTFSSTIIIVKLLSDKREIDSLHGRIAMGFLIVQDLAVVLAMMVLGSQGASGDQTRWVELAISVVLKILVAAVLIGVLMRWVLPRVLAWTSASAELLLLFSVAWGVALAASGEAFGFSKEVGAFLAGFSLASSDLREAISSRLSSLRDFLLLFFFLDLGSKLELATLGDEIASAGVLSLFVLIGNPLIVMAILGYMGYRKRTGFLAGLTVAQISEFSIVFVAMGIQLGHITSPTLGLVTLVGLITIAASTYMILFSQQLYERLERWLGPFERREPFREEAIGAEDEEQPAPAVIIFGVGRYGERLGQRLVESGHRVLGVDFDPEQCGRGQQRSFPIRFGDAEDVELLEKLHLDRATLVVSTTPQPEVNVALLGSLRRHGFIGRTALVARTENDAERYHRAGADTVLRLFADAADHAAVTLIPPEPATGSG